MSVVDVSEASADCEISFESLRDQTDSLLDGMLAMKDGHLSATDASCETTSDEEEQPRKKVGLLLGEAEDGDGDASSPTSVMRVLPAGEATPLLGSPRRVGTSEATPPSMRRPPSTSLTSTAAAPAARVAPQSASSTSAKVSEELQRWHQERDVMMPVISSLRVEMRNIANQQARVITHSSITPARPYVPLLLPFA